MIAALFVQTGGAYYGLEGVDPWDEKRDARTYPGPHPVVAHPPCSRWCQLAGVVEARYGYRRGEDDGCFASALASVRRWGGVLEHPAFSAAWATFDLNSPPTGGGWIAADFHGGWTCYIEQLAYGHAARKATWLYACGVELPELRWGKGGRGSALVSWCGNHTKPRAMVGRMHKQNPRGEYDTRPRLGKKAASASPPAFRDTLLSIARSARKHAA